MKGGKNNAKLDLNPSLSAEKRAAKVARFFLCPKICTKNAPTPVARNQLTFGLNRSLPKLFHKCSALEKIHMHNLLSINSLSLRN